MNSKDSRSDTAATNHQPTRRDPSPLEDLRELLVGPEKQKLAQLEKKLNKPLLNVEELSQLLPDAVAVSTASDNRLSRTLQPVLDNSIRESVKKNPKVLADAIFPVLGPAIRKAIIATILGMIQTLNQILNYSFTLQGLKWRWESIRTRRPFAEIILLHTLVYRVEQIFLIHNKTGVVLAHVQAKDAIIQDPDLVSSMLTAIQDFIGDSFHSETGSLIDTLRMGGDQSVWIEQGAHAIIAAVFRGTPPSDYRNRLRDLLDAIHISYYEKFESFQGDIAPFAAINVALEDLLKFKLKEIREKISPVVWLLLCLTVLLLAGWSFHGWQNYQKWQSFVTRVRSEPGLVVTEAKKKNGFYVISGLRDPLSENPARFMAESDFLKNNLISHWEPYHCLLPEFVLARARKILAPPPGVSLDYKDKTLVVRGEADHQWISRFRQKAGAISGVTSVDEENLADTSMTALTLARKNLEAIRLFFPLGQTVLTEGHDDKLKTVVDTITEIQKYQNILHSPVRIVITGNTDSSGPEFLNLQLSRQRADAVFSLLIRNGINPTFITAVGSYDTGRQDAQHPETDKPLNRNVTFTTYMFEPQRDSR